MCDICLHRARLASAATKASGGDAMDCALAAIGAAFDGSCPQRGRRRDYSVPPPKSIAIGNERAALVIERRDRS